MKTSEKLIEAQKKAMAIRPLVGGFPVLAELLRQAGVQKNTWYLPACQSVYVMDEGSVVQLGSPLVTGTSDIPVFNQVNLVMALRKDQEGRGTFPEFLQSTWESGVISYEVDFSARKVSYFGARGEVYIETYPAQQI